MHSHAEIFLFLKNYEQFQTSPPSSETFILVFSAQCLRFWEQWLKEILSCHSWKSIEIDGLFYGHHWGEPCLTQLSILKGYNNFKCALWQRWKLSAQSTLKCGKVTAARYEFGTNHCLVDIITLKINHSFTKHFENTRSCSDKIYMFQNYFQIFWKGFTRQCMSTKSTRARNDVQCPFIHQGCKTWHD